MRWRQCSPPSGERLPGRRIVVAGEMLELGKATAELHRGSGRYMASRHIDILLGVRGAAREMVDAARESGMTAEYAETSEEAGEWLAHNVRAGDIVLLKASRGVRLERALEVWTERMHSQQGSHEPQDDAGIS